MTGAAGLREPASGAKVEGVWAVKYDSAPLSLRITEGASTRASPSVVVVVLGSAFALGSL